ncbi:MAG: F0F1 ATP synthase subunit B [Chloroflexota bacterium]
MHEQIFLSALAQDIPIWFVAELLAVVIVIFLVLRWHPGFLGGRTVKDTVNQALEQREDQIREQLSAAQRSREEAERIREESKKDIARAKEEAGAIVARASTTSDSILQDLQVRARAEYERIVSQARVQIDFERQQAEAALRRRAADVVVDAAGQVLQRNLDAETDRHIIGSSLSELREVR